MTEAEVEYERQVEEAHQKSLARMRIMERREYANLDALEAHVIEFVEYSMSEHMRGCTLRELNLRFGKPAQAFAIPLRTILMRMRTLYGITAITKRRNTTTIFVTTRWWLEWTNAAREAARFKFKDNQFELALAEVNAEVRVAEDIKKATLGDIYRPPVGSVEEEPKKPNRPRRGFY